MGCGPESVEARALWVDADGEEQRRLHVYDRGALRELTVLGERSPIERVRLDPKGRGVLVRVGERRGAWIDLVDQRRLPLQLPPEPVVGPSSVQFAASGAALLWIEAGEVPALAVVPLAPGVALNRRDDGTIEPLLHPPPGSVDGAGSIDWALGASAAPVLLVAGDGGTRAEFLRYPARATEEAALTVEAVAEELALPQTVAVQRSCSSLEICRTSLALDAAGERAVFTPGAFGPWQEVDRRRLDDAGPLTLPPTLAEAQDGGTLGLLHVIDGDRSIWLGAGQLHRWDRSLGEQAGAVESFPIFAVPPYWWFVTAAGDAVVLLATSGPVFRADGAGVTAVSLETTTCNSTGAPVISPDGAWAAWTCIDSDDPSATSNGVVVRVSGHGGLERFAGVPMTTMAIDDDGDLLLYSVQTSVADQVDGIESQDLPRSLFVLSGSGILTRVDDLDPAPIPVLAGSSELGAFMQAAALPADL